MRSGILCAYLRDAVGSRESHKVQVYDLINIQVHDLIIQFMTSFAYTLTNEIVRHVYTTCCEPIKLNQLQVCLFHRFFMQ